VTFFKDQHLEIKVFRNKRGKGDKFSKAKKNKQKQTNKQTNKQKTGEEFNLEATKRERKKETQPLLCKPFYVKRNSVFT
jgi:hypothetical protein